MKFEKSNEIPICPHCQTRLDKVLKKSGGLFIFNIIFFCPYCKKVLGVSGTYLG